MPAAMSSGERSVASPRGCCQADRSVGSFPGAVPATGDPAPSAVDHTDRGDIESRPLTEIHHVRIDQHDVARGQGPAERQDQRIREITEAVFPGLLDRASSERMAHRRRGDAGENYRADRKQHDLALDRHAPLAESY